MMRAETWENKGRGLGAAPIAAERLTQMLMQQLVQTAGLVGASDCSAV